MAATDGFVDPFLDDFGSPATGGGGGPTRPRWRGVNLSGAEFSPVAATLPGTVGVDYMYPQAADFAYLASRGHKVVRLPIRWERVQPTLGGALNAAEVARLTTAIGNASNAGLKVLVDVHNYARFIQSNDDATFSDTYSDWYGTGGGGSTLVLGGGGTLTNAHLTDLWVRLSTALAGNPGVLGYGLMNEPNSLPGSAGTFTAAATPYTFDAGVSGWVGESGVTVAASATASLHGTAGQHTVMSL